MIMNNVLIIPMDRNSFNGVLKVDESTIGNVKIDTGCSFTNIPLMFFGYSKNQCRELKKFDIKNFRNGETKIIRSLGVEFNKNTKLPSIDSMTDKELFEDESICFIHSSRLFIHDFDLGIKKFKVNYDRYNHGLVGMNILSKLDFHCGYSKVLNNYIFIGVLRTQEDKSDYYKALEEHFGILSNMNENFLNSEDIKNEAAGFFDWLKNKHKN
ncbi:MAG: hypothetical protein K1W19_18255 [Lachnospiraceae bacterium]|nr:hypothetical protein [Lachnospiraceae bacterium]